jgi:hypothetical protein
MTPGSDALIRSGRLLLLLTDLRQPLPQVMEVAAGTVFFVRDALQECVAFGEWMAPFRA